MRRRDASTLVAYVPNDAAPHFSGHAGMPVAQGTRVVFVASFTRQFGDEDLVDEDVGDADAEETLL